MDEMINGARERFEKWIEGRCDGRVLVVDEELSKERGSLQYANRFENALWYTWQECEASLLQANLYASLRMDFLEYLGDLYIEKDDGWTYAISTETAQGYITAQGDTLAQAVDKLKEMIEERRQ